MSWSILFLAGLFEIAWAIGLKYTEGYTKLWPTVFTVTGMIISVWLLGIAARNLPIGTAYAIWTGIGAVGTVILGILLFHEPITIARILCLAMIVSGIIGLKLIA